MENISELKQQLAELQAKIDKLENKTIKRKRMELAEYKEEE